MISRSASSLAAIAVLGASGLVGCAADVAEVSGDVCKASQEGEPIVVLGQGRSAYAELHDDDVVEIEAGAQGGHHVWLAVRTKGLTRAGSVIRVTGYFPELDADVPPVSVGVTFHEAGDGFCELYGLRLRVDHGIGVDEVRGELLEIDVSVEDPMGDVAISSKTVRVADAVNLERERSSPGR